VAGVSFAAEGQPGSVQLVTVLSGQFSDPGFDRAAAGTRETFTATVHWGDGTTENIPVTLVQGSNGVLTTGSVSARHTYTRGQVYAATVTLADDDGRARRGRGSLCLRPGPHRRGPQPHPQK
jgi:hypothetical protein